MVSNTARLDRVESDVAHLRRGLVSLMPRRHKQKKPKKERPHSFIRDAWVLAVERARTRRAMRLLTKQEWSVDFLTALLVRAANVAHRPLEMEIRHRDTAVTIRTTDELTSSFRDESIFNHLDDDLRVRQFIEEVNR